MPAQEGASTIKLAPNAMSTLEIIKIMLSIKADDYSYDDYLILMINYVSGWIEKQVGRRLDLGVYSEPVTPSGYQELPLENYPIRIIESITNSATGASLPNKSYSFTRDGHFGVVYKDDGWSRQGYPTGLVPDFVLSKRYLVVDYTAGYVLPKDVIEGVTPEDWKLPSDLHGIVWQVVAQELALADSGADGLSAFSISDVSWTFDKAPRQSWIDILNNYKRVV